MRAVRVHALPYSWDGMFKNVYMRYNVKALSYQLYLNRLWGYSNNLRTIVYECDEPSDQISRHNIIVLLRRLFEIKLRHL